MNFSALHYFLCIFGILNFLSWDFRALGFQHHARLGVELHTPVIRQKSIGVLLYAAKKSQSISNISLQEDESETKTKKPTKRKKKPASTEPPFWRNHTDNVILDYFPGSSQLPRSVQFTIRGNPLPLRRHRTSRGFMYNPSAKAQECFRDLVHQMLVEEITSLNATTISSVSSDSRTDNNNFTSVTSFFGNSSSLSLVARFSMRRPNTHFVASKRGRPLKASAPSSLSRIRTDVDNLAKFVLDSMNGLLYEDDAQVVNLCVSKALDNDEECLGSTIVTVVALNDFDEFSNVVHGTVLLHPDTNDQVRCTHH